MPFTLESTWLLKFAFPFAIRPTISSPSMNLRNPLYVICPLFSSSLTRRLMPSGRAIRGRSAPQRQLNPYGFSIAW